MENIINKHILINNIKTLVDLNEDDMYFDIDFKVTSKKGEPFIISVVDQNTLDNQEDLEYKEVEDGFISGNIKNNKNIYQNYFLCLRSMSDSEIECDVEIIRKTPPKPIDNDNLESEQLNQEGSSYNHYNNKNFYNCIVEWKWYIFYTFLILIFLYFLYYYNNNKIKNSLNNTKSVTNTDNSNFGCGISSSVEPSIDNTIAQQFKFLYHSSQ